MIDFKYKSTLMKKLYSKFGVLILGVIITLSMYSLGYSETFSINTYFPISHGVFDRLNFYPSSVDLPTPCEIGTLYTDSNEDLRFCVDDGSASDTGMWSYFSDGWNQSGDNLFPADTTTNPNLKIGIGTSTPQGLLHVHEPGFNVDWSSSNLLQGDLIISADQPRITLAQRSRSAIQFPEIDSSGNYTNMWSMGRTAISGEIQYFMSFMESTGNYYDDEDNRALSVHKDGRVGLGALLSPATEVGFIDKFEGGSKLESTYWWSRSDPMLRLDEASGAIDRVWEFRLINYRIPQSSIPDVSLLELYGGTPGNLTLFRSFDSINEVQDMLLEGQTPTVLFDLSPEPQYRFLSPEGSDALLFQSKPPSESWQDCVTILGNGNMGVSETQPVKKLHIVSDHINNVHYSNADGVVIEVSDSATHLYSSHPLVKDAHIILSAAPGSGSNKHWFISSWDLDRAFELSIGYGTSN